MNDDRAICTSRILPFAPQAVYGAFAAVDLLASWWGPDGFTNSFEVFEFKVGGRWTFVMHSPDGKNYPNTCIVVGLEPNEKVVIQHDCAPYFTLTVRLAPVGGSTHLFWEQVFDDATTAQAVKNIVEPANEQNIDRLTRVLSHAAGAV